jgi:hypothetical protein
MRWTPPQPLAPCRVRCSRRSATKSRTGTVLIPIAWMIWHRHRVLPGMHMEPERAARLRAEEPPRFSARFFNEMRFRRGSDEQSGVAGPTDLGTGRAFTLFVRAARAGLSLAQRWFRAAAERGHVEAQNVLGRYLARGLAGDHDADSARLWLGRATAQGQADARLELACLGPAPRVEPSTQARSSPRTQPQWV